MNNLHICLNEFTNASRVLKQTSSIASLDFIDHIHIAALHSGSLETNRSLNENIHLKRFSLTTRNLGKNLFVQLFKYFEFCIRVAFHYRNKGVGIVNVHSLALLPLGVILKYLYGAKLIYDTHELETETNGLKGVRKQLSKLVERTLFPFVDLTIVVSENIADWYRARYDVPRPPVVLNAPKLSTPTASDRFRTRFNLKENQVVFLYQGVLMKGRGVKFLIDVFKSRVDDAAVIVFMGDGNLEEEVIRAAAESSNIFYHPAVAPEVVLEYTVCADLGISFIEDTCLSYYYCMPNKLFEYAMAGLPVIVSDMKEMREFVTEYDFGYVCNTGDVKALCKLVDQVLTEDLSTKRCHARLAAEKNSWEQQESKMLEAYQILFR